MTKSEAFTLISQICRKVQTDFDTHTAIQTALALLDPNKGEE